MKFDVIIMGGGIAGFSAAIRCLEAGLKTCVITSGQNALHFSSGNIDVLSHIDGVAVDQPFSSIGKLAKSHPYTKMGASQVKCALEWFIEQCRAEDLYLYKKTQDENQTKLTATGQLKHTYLSTTPHFSHQTKQVNRYAIIDVVGYHDFQAMLMKRGMIESGLAKDSDISIVNLNIESLHAKSTQHTLRSIDVQRVLSSPAGWQQLTQAIVTNTQEKTHVLMPSLLDPKDLNYSYTSLAQQVQRDVSAIVTMPPSIIGMSLHQILHARAVKLGATVLKGDRVTHFEQAENAISSIYTQKLADIPLQGEQFILATGSYFSRGLVCEKDQIREPIFNLDVHQINNRDQWTHPQLLNAQSHPFMRFGVETDETFKGTRNGKAINNLYCCGSVLAHYDPVAEGSGNGVAVSSAFHVANSIIEYFNQRNIQEAV